MNQREKRSSSDAEADAANDGSNPVRQRLMHMLGLTMPPRSTTSTATQTSNNSGLRSAGTQTDQPSTSAAASGAAATYRYTRY